MPVTFKQEDTATCFGNNCNQPPAYRVITLTAKGVVENEHVGGFGISLLCRECLSREHSLSEIGEPIYFGDHEVPGPPDIKTEVSGEARITGGPPVKGAKVQLAGIAGQTQLISNAEGRFHAVLKPGTYEVTAEFPTGYEYESCGWSSITVVEHRCARLIVSAEPKTSIAAPSSK